MSQLDKLYAKHLYDIAISLAISSHSDKANIMDIYRCVVFAVFLAFGIMCMCHDSKYGDYLYDDGNYDGAVTQYAATIG